MEAVWYGSFSTLGSCHQEKAVRFRFLDQRCLRLAGLSIELIWKIVNTIYNNSFSCFLSRFRIKTMVKKVRILIKSDNFYAATVQCKKCTYIMLFSFQKLSKWWDIYTRRSIKEISIFIFSWNLVFPAFHRLSRGTEIVDLNPTNIALIKKILRIRLHM